MANGKWQRVKGRGQSAVCGLLPFPHFSVPRFSVHRSAEGRAGPITIGGGIGASRVSPLLGSSSRWGCRFQGVALRCGLYAPLGRGLGRAFAGVWRPPIVWGSASRCRDSSPAIILPVFCSPSWRSVHAVPTHLPGVPCPTSLAMAAAKSPPAKFFPPWFTPIILPPSFCHHDSALHDSARFP